MLSKQALEEFKSLWSKEYGTTLTDGDAAEIAATLLTLFNAVYRPIKRA